MLGVILILVGFLLVAIVRAMLSDDTPPVETNKLLEQQKAQQRQKEEQERERIDRELVEKYLGDDHVKQILRLICEGDYLHNHPEEIVIYDDRLESSINGKKVSARFRDVGSDIWLSYSFVVVDGYYISYDGNRQVAMANAVNSLMANIYEIRDEAERALDISHDDDKEITTVTRRYISYRVVMTRKS